MRIPSASNLESRDGTVNKGGKVTNGMIETKGQQDPFPKVRKRPGCSDYGLVRAGLAQLLVYWNGIKTIIGDYFNAVGDQVAYQSSCTWNPADKDADVTLSGSNLTAALTANSGSVRGTLGVSSGTMYFEVTLNNGDPGSIYIGCANLSMAITALPGQDLNSVSRFSNQMLSNGISIAAIAQPVLTNVVGVLIDATARTINFYLNGTFQYQATSAAVPSGTLYPCIGLDKIVLNVSLTANFGATAFAYPITNVQSTNLSPTAASLLFSAQDNGSNAGTDYLMFKNASQAWTLTPSGTPTLITDVDYPGISTVSVTQITRSGNTATAQTPADTNFQVGSAVTISGAVETDYNGVHTITAITSSATVPEVAIPISITRSGTTATATSTTRPHGFINGQVVPIRGANENEYNGSKTITWISATQFSFTVTVTGTDVSTPAGGSPIINPYPLLLKITNTVGAPTVFAGVYYNPADNGTLVNGDTFTIADYALGACTISAAALGTFTLTSTGWSVPGVAATVPITAFPTSPTISSITSGGGTAIATTSAAHKYATGKQITISGATPIVYNGLVTITVLSTTTFSYTLPGPVATPASPATGIIVAGDPAIITGPSFSYTVANTPTTPATGTISASGGRNTVPGIAYLNGYFIVMDVNGVVYNSAIDNPTAWSALEFTTADNETGAGMALAKSLNYIVAFKEWSTEFFVDGKNAVGSPLNPVENGFTLIGCASGTSVANVDGTLAWLAQVRQRGRSVYIMTGITQSKVSTPDVERILNADDLATVYAYGLKINGHACYVLTLVTSNVTLVFDLASHLWYVWTSYTLGSSVVGTITITRVGDVATWTSTNAHGRSDGDPFLISGCTQTEYNGIHQITYIDATSFSFPVTGSPATPATGAPVGKGYTESYFKFTQYADCGGLDLMLHESDGHLYEIDPDLYQDAGIPINYMLRSQKLDGSTSAIKFMGTLTLVGDEITDTAMVRWTDDDYQSYNPYRTIDLSLELPQARRCGHFRRRAIEVKHIGNTRPIWDAIEMEIK